MKLINTIELNTIYFINIFVCLYLISITNQVIADSFRIVCSNIRNLTVVYYLLMVLLILMPI